MANPEAAPVSPVNADHPRTTPVRTARDPTASARRPTGTMNAP